MEHVVQLRTRTVCLLAIQCPELSPTHYMTMMLLLLLLHLSLQVCMGLSTLIRLSFSLAFYCCRPRFSLYVLSAVSTWRPSTEYNSPSVLPRVIPILTLPRDSSSEPFIHIPALSP